MTIDELLGLLDMQEEILQFSHFTNADAWAVGNCIVEEALKRKLPVSVSIRLNNGLTVFQYAADGVNLQSERWMQRKMNTVRTLERSSLYASVLLRKNEETLADWYLDEKGNLKREAKHDNPLKLGHEIANKDILEKR